MSTSTVMQQKPANETVLRKKERTRRTILNAAAKVFKHLGYNATTLKDIAEEAGLKAGSMYYHFSSKDEIMDEVLDTGLRAISDAVNETIEECADKNDKEILEAVIQTHLRMLFLQGDYVSANIRLYSQLPEEIREKHQDLRRGYAKLWDRLLRKARDSGHLRSELEITPLRQFILGALNWSIEWYDIENYTVEEFSEKAIKLIGHGMYTSD
ncbi:TetR family transcriptional regulator [Sneathiella sp. P13V-1]|uniref:TetR family transcriptional regulator n=1 Tax=Sneathiella sp. P13V-1 TaxID=2697366 RepID=UPI00187B2E41|nr:TetR/AcrR family transcriptional regulator [Sneathiella sp. P13V-1]MBE7637488.1 TetR family transcriptional regulator [Sneathiella sp. P13V-1]